MGFRWIWIDTCCINKADGPETNESINRMFQWYQQAAVCCVYLADFQCDGARALSGQRLSRGKFQASVWFSRGWTLQEPRPRVNYRFVWFRSVHFQSLSHPISDAFEPTSHELAKNRLACIRAIRAPSRIAGSDIITN